MGKIGLIIWREYSTKIRNKTFLIMSILGPLLISGLSTLVVWLPTVDKTEQKIMVIDDSGLFGKNHFTENKLVKFYYPDLKLDQGIKTLYETDFTSVLHIPYNVLSGGHKANIYYKKAMGFAAQNYLNTQLENKIYEFTLQSNNIDPMIIKNARIKVELSVTKVEENGKLIDAGSESRAWIGFIAGILIFISIVIYGAQVMRGVMEEKSNRIVEVIISSVKPFQLMLGKIIGVAMVGLTQFVIWIILSLVLTTASTSYFMGDILKEVEQYKEQNEIVYKQGSNADFHKIKPMASKAEAIQKIMNMQDVDVTEVIICFILYFMGGYLLYASLYAAIGAAVDNETDTQQFMLPVTLPLILGYVLSVNFMQNPDSTAAFWGSMIPFTSPVVMMVRLPFGVPAWQIAVSLLSLVAGFLLTTWLAAKIYRTGILMYGKKVNWKELGKWLFYKG